MQTWYPRFLGKKTARGEKLHILGMLRAQRRHISFHTPGHKRGGADITELSYSDNLASPAGVIAEAQADLARITGAAQSFLLTDGSTSGVHAMLHALASRGIRRVACPERSHRSVATGCELAGLVRVSVFCGTAAQALKSRIGAYPNADWSKLLLPFGDRADAAQAALERQGIYPEFNDGNYLMFYLSPATTRGELKTLERALRRLPRGTLRTLQAERGEIPLGARIVVLPPAEAEGRVCAADCGLFPPCIPLILRGERVGAAQAALLQRAGGTFGLREGKIPVFEEA